MAKETKKFKTEIKQILELIINSLYSNAEIALRELISNAADAIDKARYESLTNKDVLEDNAEWKIKIIPDEKAGTITIHDNGIGMNKASIVQNLGTIAQSGTRTFMDNLKEIKDRPELIGQFGVGFYSSFIIGESVTVISRTAGDKSLGVKWECTGMEAYSVEQVEKATRGTDVIVKLKDDYKDYLKEWKIREIVKKYSDYVEHPITMDVEREDDKKKKKEVKEETLNSQKAIWLKSKSEIKDNEYNDFYKHISSDWTDPSKVIHYSAEGATEFKALLYLPSKQPFDMFQPERKQGLHLYVRRIFITDDCKKLMPEYLRFVKGVVDSFDLPLNVSRELLQDNKLVEQIRKSLVNKVFATLKTMLSKDKDEYIKFYQEFGKVLKEGMHFDYENKDKLQDLLLFETSKAKPGELITLKEYSGRMAKDQKEIYFITGDDRQQVEGSPYLEAFKKKDYEVLFLIDPVDEWVAQSLTEYDKKKLKSINKGEVDLGDDETKKTKKEKEKKFKSLVENIKSHLPDVKEVRLSSRLTESACCLVADEHEMGAHMERLMRSMNQQIPESKRILELNPTHPIIETMQKLFDKDKKHIKLQEYAELLYDQALLTEGSKVKDPLKFAQRVNDLMYQESKTLV